jgi:hypothetical protein
MIVKLKYIEAYEKVTYYSVALYDEDEHLISGYGSIFEDFIKGHERKNYSELDYILNWIKHIGNVKGALPHYFRFENRASGLPPKDKVANKENVSFVDVENQNHVLRLYCLPLNKQVVILFGGGIKTADKAQDCPNVGSHFKLANKLAEAIDEAIKQGDIDLLDDDLAYDDDLEMMI